MAGSIFLVGMMGAGKSTVGPRLAARLGRAFVDTDHAVEERAGRTVARIFEEDGEAAFRRLEREAIEAAASERAVVALGGGAMAQPGAPDWLAARGTVVWLKADAATLLARIGDASSRPLLAGLAPEAQRARLETLMAEREAAYAQAGLHVDATADAAQVVDDIVAALVSDAIDGQSAR